VHGHKESPELCEQVSKMIKHKLSLVPIIAGVELRGETGIASVHFASSADTKCHQRHARFTPESRHLAVRLACLLRAFSGHVSPSPMISITSSLHFLSAHNRRIQVNAGDCRIVNSRQFATHFCTPLGADSKLGAPPADGAAMRRAIPWPRAVGCCAAMADAGN
jgi:hypothetical protein